MSDIIYEGPSHETGRMFTIFDSRTLRGWVGNAPTRLRVFRFANCKLGGAPDGDY